MKKTSKIDIHLPHKTDVIAAGNKLKSIPGVAGVSVVTMQQLRVKYNPKQITAVALAEMVGASQTKIS